jgi:gas vesicle protein
VLLFKVAFAKRSERGFTMRNIGNKNVKDWVRLAAKLSLLFTEPKVRAAVGERIKDSVSDLTDTVSSKYDDVSDTVSSRYADAVDRFDSFRGKNYWPSRVTGFLLGVGIGAGLGILLAPASGSETRETVRGKAADVTNKIRRSVLSMPPTGTEV